MDELPRPHRSTIRRIAPGRPSIGDSIGAWSTSAVTKGEPDAAKTGTGRREHGDDRGADANWNRRGTGDVRDHGIRVSMAERRPEGAAGPVSKNESSSGRRSSLTKPTSHLRRRRGIPCRRGTRRRFGSTASDPDWNRRYLRQIYRLDTYPFDTIFMRRTVRTRRSNVVTNVRTGTIGGISAG